VLTVHPGYSGQEFMGEVIPKITEVRHRLDALGSSARLEVDGGISPQTISQVRDAGADAFVAASAIFKHPDGIADGVRTLKNALMTKSLLP
jgi:ribulose-phosphate 3-epimerase